MHHVKDDDGCQGHADGAPGRDAVAAPRKQRPS